MDQGVVILSWSKMWSRLGNGEIAWGSLDNARFFLGCLREHVEDPFAGEVNEISWGYPDATGDDLRALHRRFLDKFAAADLQGRVAWRNRDSCSETQSRFLSLLGEHAPPEGLDPLEVSYPALADAARALGFNPLY